MDRARARRYLQAVGVVLWRSRDSVDAEPEVFDAHDTDVPSGDARALDLPMVGQTGSAGARSGGMAAIAATKALLGTSKPAPTSSASTAPPAASDSLGAGLTPTLADHADDARAIATMDWSALEAEVRNCQRCGLCARRNQAVFGVGNRQARLMLIGEAPGAEEDRKGEPFVGRAGQLLTEMLAAIDLPRDQVYIGNMIKCRPPQNRDPLPEEIATCRAFIERQIELVAPDLLLCLGRISAHSLLNTSDALWRLRGRWHRYGPRNIPLLVTFHPSYYLHDRLGEKALGWDDLQRLARCLREGPPA